MEHVVKLRGYLSVCAAAGGVRHRGVDPSKGCTRGMVLECSSEQLFRETEYDRQGQRSSHVFQLCTCTYRFPVTRDTRKGHVASSQV